LYPAASIKRMDLLMGKAVPVGSLVVGIRFAAIDFVGNDRSGAAPGQPSAERGMDAFVMQASEKPAQSELSSVRFGTVSSRR
jgi:hypothetical protein